MKNIKFILFTLFILFLSFTANLQAQTKKNTEKPAVSTQNSQALKSSPAYAEILLRKTERTAELEDLLVEYTEEFPKVKQLRAELELINNAMNRILAVNPSEAGKLTLALGKLMLRKIDFEMDYKNLQSQYNNDYPDVKQAKRKVEVFEAAIKEILQ